jgi:hypothetical protein
MHVLVHRLLEGVDVRIASPGKLSVEINYEDIKEF